VDLVYIVTTGFVKKQGGEVAYKLKMKNNVVDFRGVKPGRSVFFVDISDIKM